jgi:hypothetical protein
MERQTRRVNLIDRNVDMHVVRIVVDHAYALGLAASLGTFLEPHHSQSMKSNCKLSDKMIPTPGSDLMGERQKVGGPVLVTILH